MNTRVVGYQIARFVQFHRRSVQISHKTNLFVLKRFLEHIENATNVVSTSDNSNWGPLYLIGHSLGAHICGFASKELKRRQSKWKIDRKDNRIGPCATVFQECRFQRETS